MATQTAESRRPRILPRTARRRTASMICLAALLASGTSTRLALTSDPQEAAPGRDTTTSERASTASAPRQRREGDRYQGRGRFEITGDRITFYSADNQEVFRVVENLALERVTRILEDPAEATTTRQWHIQAEVLEYRGANFLRLERVLLKSMEP